MCTSIPPEDTKYKNVYPTTITDADGTKLVIGTKTFNALITSSLRLDTPFNPEVGPSVMSFDLNDSSKAKATTIFVKESAWKEAAEIAQNNNAASIAPYDLIYQLRQLRTRFHQQLTYFLCRASNETVDNLAARPYTIYTLAEWDNDNDNADLLFTPLILYHYQRTTIEEDMNESELCSRFVDPFLSGLFDDPNAGVYLRWTNETTLETKKHGNQDGLRPDMCITKSYGVKWSSSCGYGEAKASKQAEDHHAVCYDLLKVAAFCKNALNKQKFDGILGIQIVGRTIIFYVLLLPATKLYTMLRLAEIKLPDSLQGLPSLVTELPNILGVLDVFDNLCIPAKDIKRAIDCQTSTEPMSLFNLILSSSKDRKRHCHLKLRHN
ncbi:hypothetical protein G6F57_006219 [Rhizopus arrhizus]|uniref:Uncharacterized protein n=1 Tax=Rhizopus oryzae TaxID=64495 RepID=A0A9P7BX51_RHIOR|nr:hypothetical protein G6F24_012312 [Rhizopus arrhizus]KAG1408787.1 hypothetical protein G6F58_009441 [Rhizopus delemar]KAG0905310.1 hypothetical protein G6F33_012268 [Rhizopus arrhizus]KAG0930293.1 hypothetical protein G6F32_012045 [Rhizopus arrhizus]KAG0932716.1 hypothetical protein G6F30_010613 [Rhizopus arrhizus]